MQCSISSREEKLNMWPRCSTLYITYPLPIIFFGNGGLYCLAYSHIFESMGSCAQLDIGLALYSSEYSNQYFAIIFYKPGIRDKTQGIVNRLLSSRNRGVIHCNGFISLYGPSQPLLISISSTLSLVASVAF